MKQITLKFYILLIVGFSAAGCSNYYYQTAEKHYNNLAYSKAIKYYEKVAGKEKFAKAGKKLAECYRLTNNYEKQEFWYSQIYDSPLMEDKDFLYFAQSLINNGKFVEAQIPLMKYLEVKLDDGDAKNIQLTLNSYWEYFQDSSDYEIKLLDINLPLISSFSPVYFQDGIVFSTERSKGMFTKQCDWTGRPYLDLYFSRILGDGSYGRPETFSGINWKYHEGPCAFNNEGSEIYFTASLFDKDERLVKNSNGINSLRIFKAQKINHNWSNVEEVHLFNDELVSHGHPAFSPDNNLLFFISDMQNGFGGTDVYVCEKESDRWGKPQNLGPSVNTSGNEMFPFMSVDGKLYFSSDGQGGLGVMDIFSSTFENGQWTKPVNLGFPFNSFGDDIGFIIRGESGFFSSNRESPNGIDYLYSFKKQEPRFFVNGVVVNNETKAPVKSAVVQLLEQGQNVFEIITDSTGSFSFPLQANKDYLVLAKNQVYSANAQLSTWNKKNSENFNVKLELPDPVFSLKGKVVDNDTRQPLAGVKMQLSNLSLPGEIKETMTDENGDFFLELGQEQVYSLTGSKENYLTAVRNSTTIGKTRSEQVFMELPLAKLVINKPMRVDNIFYDYDKWDIREDAKQELTKLVELMVVNPSILIELSSHSDSRGGDQHNLKLSQKRAESAVNYIVVNGIDPTRIRAKGYGETRLLNKCANGIPCSEEDHQSNRRTEFKVTGVNLPQLTSVN